MQNVGENLGAAESCLTFDAPVLKQFGASPSCFYPPTHSWNRTSLHYVKRHVLELHLLYIIIFVIFRFHSSLITLTGVMPSLCPLFDRGAIWGGDSYPHLC